MLAIRSLVPLPFLKPAWTSGSSQFTYCWSLAWRILSMWDESNCVVLWAFFGIAFLWNWSENWPFLVLWPLLSFPNLLADILEYEVKWTLKSITRNKASGGDGVPVELFQILKDDAIKVLHSICQQIWKTQQWPQDWKRSVFIPILKKGNAKECSNYHTIAFISHASKVMLKILQARLQQYMNCELPDVQAGFRKGRGTRDQIANIW